MNCITLCLLVSRRFFSGLKPSVWQVSGSAVSGSLVSSSRVSRLVICFGLSLFVCVSSHAQTSSADGQWLLAKYDLNGDAKITEAEVVEKKLRVFRQMDGDQNGRLSFSEYQDMDLARREFLLKSRFDKLDKDGNGQISDQEYADFMGMFASIDSNGDGTLTKDEVQGEPPEAFVTRCLVWFCFRSKMSTE